MALPQTESISRLAIRVIMIGNWAVLERDSRMLTHLSSAGQTCGNCGSGDFRALIGQASPHIDEQADGHQALRGQPDVVTPKAAGDEVTPGLQTPALLGAHRVHITGWVEVVVPRTGFQTQQGRSLHESRQVRVHVERDRMDLQAAADSASRIWIP